MRAHHPNDKEKNKNFAGALTFDTIHARTPATFKKIEPGNLYLPTTSGSFKMLALWRMVRLLVHKRALVTIVITVCSNYVMIKNFFFSIFR